MLPIGERDLVAGTEFQTTVGGTCMRGNELTAFSLGRPLCPGNVHISPQFHSFSISMRSFICLFLIGAMMAVKAAEEEFREELTLRPLPDGKVAAHFSFSTLLRGAVPRAPSSLGTDDTCMLHPTHLT